ncbi:hypothetical protein [Zooshikella sp. RANM57]|uniref:hypothetical protein n=1 Tax=Zooshikella sp. RANM57 TaxID=3425863 RepID=UPI003D6E5933
MDLYYTLIFISFTFITASILIPLFPKEIFVYYFFHGNSKKKVELLLIAKQLTEKVTMVRKDLSQKLQLTYYIKPALYGIFLQIIIFLSHYFHIMNIGQDAINLTLLVIFIIYSGHIVYNLSILLQKIVYIKRQQSTLKLLKQLNRKEKDIKKGLSF